jgi:hypothetical protein
MIARRYDTIAMDELMEQAQDCVDRGEPELADVPYLLAALNHYRQGYAALYLQREVISEAVMNHCSRRPICTVGLLEHDRHDEETCGCSMCAGARAFKAQS